MVNGDSTNELLDDEPRLRIARRTLLRLGFLGSLAALAVAAAAAFLRFLYPRDDTPHDYVDLPQSSAPHPGDAPVDHVILRDGIEAKIYLVNLRAGEGLLQRSLTSPGGLIAFSRKCPDEGCTLPWNPNHAWQANGTSGTGAFKCPCRGGAFTKAGVKIAGPAARNMDTYEIQLHGPDKLRVYAKKLHNGTAPGAPPNPTMFVSSPTA